MTFTTLLSSMPVLCASLEPRIMPGNPLVSFSFSNDPCFKCFSMSGRIVQRNALDLRASGLAAPAGRPAEPDRKDWAPR